MSTDLKIFIPTLGRVQKQSTYNRLPDVLKKKTFIVCPTEEVYAHEDLGRQVIACDKIGIGPTRDYIVDWAANKDIKYIVMLDDDVVLQRRRHDFRITNVKTEEEYLAAFEWLGKTLEIVAHCGWGTRFLGYATQGKETSPGRMMYCLAYDVDVVKKLGASFSKGAPWDGTMEDFYMTLQLLQAGYPNVVSLEWRASPGPSNAKGGCSTWRTTKCQNESAERLARLYPNLVTVRHKKNWDGMGEGMLDVRIAWRKATSHFIRE